MIKRMVPVFMALFFSVQLIADLKPDQYQCATSVFSVAQIKAMQVCNENGYSYFKYIFLSYRDEKGQTIEYKGGCKDPLGKIFKVTLDDLQLDFLGKGRMEFDILCYHKPPKDEYVCSVRNFFNPQGVVENGETTNESIRDTHELDRREGSR